MGVIGLWKLLEGAGKEVSLESLEGKVFAVDASILLNQAIKGMKDQPNAHLHVLFLRICKLLTYQIKPIFVFDGSMPILKRETLAARQRKRDEASVQAQEVTEKLRRKKVQQFALDKLLGKRGSELPSASKDPDMFELPPVPEASSTEDDKYSDLAIHDIIYAEDFDVSQIDIESEGFKSLPAEYQHEMLEELKEYNKHNLPRDHAYEELQNSNEFSSFQLSKIVKNNKLTQKIEGLRKVMIGSLSDFQNSDGQSVTANRIMSEDSTQSLLIQRNSIISNPVKPDRIDSTQPDSNHSILYNVREQSSEPVYFANHKRKVATAINLDEEHGELSSTDSTDEILAEVDQSHVSLSTTKRPTYDTSETNGNSLTLSRNDKTPRLSSGFESEPSVVKRRVISTSESNSGDEMIESVDIKCDHAQNIPLSIQSDLTDHSSEITKEEEFELSDNEQYNNELSKDRPHHNNHDQPTYKQALSDISDLMKSDRTKAPTDTPVEPTSLRVTIDPSLELDSEHDLFSPTIFMPAAEKSENPSTQLEACKSSQLTDEVSEEPEPLPDRFTSQSIGEMRRELGSEARVLNQELRKQEALSTLVSKQMIDDCLELLRYFGVPYIISPSEAEAQCATLNELGLCEGVITEDSDVWLFGASYVLKNFFQQERSVLAYHIRDVHQLYGLDRRKMIAVALVSGSDYTSGITNAGPVTAMEIISEFDTTDGIKALRLFKEWYNRIQQNGGKVPVGLRNNPTRNKLRRLVQVSESFPNHVVVEAYLKPAVDDSTEVFEWGKPDLDLLRKCAHSKLGWPSQKVDDLVTPVLKRLNSQKKQATLHNYLHINPATSIVAKRDFHSKRVKAAIDKILGDKEVQVTPHNQDKEVKHDDSLPSSSSQPSKKITNKAPKRGASSNKAKPVAKKVRAPVKKAVRAVADAVNLSASDSE